MNRSTWPPISPSEAAHSLPRAALGCAIVELTLAIGLRRVVAQLTNGFEIPLEDGPESWPPDGLAPGGRAAVSGAFAEAAVLRRPRLLERCRLPLPEVGEDDGILSIEACGLCGTDHEQYTGHLAPPFGFVPGHEIVGVVERAGSHALERWGVALGDRVAVEVFMSCGQCAACASGVYRRCERHGLADMYGFVDVERPPGLWGGYATHLYLAPDTLLLCVPQSIDPVVATVFNPLGAGLR